MTAGEDQLESVIGHCIVLCGEVRVDIGRVGQPRQPLAQRALAAEAVDRDVAGRGDDPPQRRVRDAVGRPARGRTRERLLHGLLGQIGIAEAAHQRRHGPAPVLAEGGRRRLGRAYRSTNGRTSIDPCLAPGMRAALSIASSIVSHSITK